MKHIGVLALLLFSWVISASADNIRIDSVRYRASSVGGGQGARLKMTFTVVWENSWRDAYNYDAAYVFFKFKKKDADTKHPESWHHLYLAADGHRIVGEQDSAAYDFWLSPLSESGTNYNTGLYIYRRGHGVWAKDSVQMEVTWDIEHQLLVDQLKTDDIRNGNVQVVGHAIEMVYIPRGAYRIGDGISNRGFRKLAFPLLEEYDIVTTDYEFSASIGDPKLAADRINDNSNRVLSDWSGEGETSWWWQIDFGRGNEKEITYFGVNASKRQPTYIPTYFVLEGSKDPDVTNPVWDRLWRGAGQGNWIVPKDAYPIEKALRLEKTGKYRVYRLRIEGMTAGFPLVSSIGMTEANLDDLVDYSVLIDSPVTTKDSMRHLGAGDGTVWTDGKIPATFPNGYSAFYAMKYELSQEQYVGFLNKLTYDQQNGLLNGVLDDLEEGDYIFGDKEQANHRNGIILAVKIKGMPAVFGCDLNGNHISSEADDGMNIACNYISIDDMLAYADWACLRPLSEMEYEKMCRPLYPAFPERMGYAWGTTNWVNPQINVTGREDEWASQGYANGNQVLDYPVKVGAFARTTDPSMEMSGAGYWGCMDLSGNLAEIYYNVNHLGLELLLSDSLSGDAGIRTNHQTAHGDGMLDGDGSYNGVASKQWGEDMEMFGIRGGSYASELSELSVADRTWFTGRFEASTQRDSSVTFRLGRTAPTFAELDSWLISESETTTKDGMCNDFFLANGIYVVRGNVPENPQGGAISYIWYSSESGGEMKVLEGEVNQGLYFNKYKNNTSLSQNRGMNMIFKRKVITPYTDSETSSENMIYLITNPFDSDIETFRYSTDTYQVKSNWDISIPHRWGFDKPYPGLSIDEQTGVISGLNATTCNVTVTLVSLQSPDIIYKKQVKETVRDYTAVNGNIRKLKLTAGSYQIECWGASGGAKTIALSLKGAYAMSPYVAAEATDISILVGMQGGWGNSAGGGGGGSFVVAGTNTPICIGGGGGGNQYNQAVTGATYYYAYGQASNYGGRHAACSAVGVGQGGSGNTVSGACGGGGLLSNGGQGNYGRPGVAFVNGGTAVAGTNYSSASGGFGGGASTHGNSGGGGGGGGYTGGSGGNHNSPFHGGGGGSYWLSGGRAIAGYKSMPAINGGNETGHYGNGHIRITLK